MREHLRERQVSHLRQAGQTMAEFAFIFALFMFIVVAVVDFSRVVYDRSVIANAAREGARYGSTHARPSLDLNAVVSATRQKILGLETLGPNDLQISAIANPVMHPIDPSRTITQVQVDITYTFRPLVFNITTTLRARSVMFVDGQ